MPSPLQPSINLSKALGSQSFDDSVAPGPYQAAGDSALVVVTLTAAGNLDLPGFADGANLGQLMIVQLTLVSGAQLTINGTAAILSPGQVALIGATDDGAGGISWVPLVVV